MKVKFNNWSTEFTSLNIRPQIVTIADEGPVNKLCSVITIILRDKHLDIEAVSLDVNNEFNGIAEILDGDNSVAVFKGYKINQISQTFPEDGNSIVIVLIKELE